MAMHPTSSWRTRTQWLWARTLGATSAALVAATLVIAGCSDRQLPPLGDREGEPIGSIELALTLPDGSMLTQVDYRVTGGPLPAPVIGSIPVGGPGATISAAVLLPPGMGYTVQLSAVTSAGIPCGATSMFSITAGLITNVTMVLACGAPEDNGLLVINGRLDRCPRMTAFAAAPLETNVGETVTLTSSAVDDDGTAVTYAWTATGGTFANPAAANTTWTCPAVGSYDLTLVVSDGQQPCDRTTKVTVVCTASSTPTTLPVFQVMASGLTAAQADALRASFGLANLALDERGVARYADEKAFIGLPVLPVDTQPPAGDDQHVGAVASQQFDFEAIRRIQVLDPQAAQARVESALRQAGLLPAGVSGRR